MVNPYSSFNTFNYTPPNGVYRPFVLIDPAVWSATTSTIISEIEENSKELKINVKKHQIKFNFAL